MICYRLAIPHEGRRRTRADPLPFLLLCSDVLGELLANLLDFRGRVNRTLRRAVGDNDDPSTVEIYANEHVCVDAGKHVPGTPLEVAEMAEMNGRLENHVESLRAEAADLLGVDDVGALAENHVPSIRDKSSPDRPATGYLSLFLPAGLPSPWCSCGSDHGEIIVRLEPIEGAEDAATRSPKGRASESNIRHRARLSPRNDTNISDSS